MPLIRLISAFALLLMSLGPAHAETADQIANIRNAVARIAVVEKEKGYMGALVEIKRCYLRELKIARSLTPALQACIAQDIIMSRVAAATLAKIPENSRKASGSLEPAKIMRDMLDRVPKVFARFHVPEIQARLFTQLVNKHGNEAYGRARFPEIFSNKN